MLFSILFQYPGVVLPMTIYAILPGNAQEFSEIYLAPYLG